MRIHSITVLLSLPFIIPFAYFGYRILYLGKNENIWYLLVTLTILVALYIFHPYIDYLWYKRFPDLLNKQDVVILERFSSFYNSLEQSEKEKFQKRVNVFTRAKEFKLMRKEVADSPEDLKIAVASCAVELTFNLDDFLFEGFDYYYIYMHPFPTPRIHTLHSVETDHEDGLVILNAEKLINSLNPGNNIFNIGIYAFSGLFMYLKKPDFIPLSDYEELWTYVESIGGFQKSDVVLTTGLEEPPQFQILTSLFFANNERFREILPNQYDQLCKIYNYKTKAS